MVSEKKKSEETREKERKSRKANAQNSYKFWVSLKG